MRCPICQSDLVLVKQNTLYCSACRIYIGKKESYKNTFEKPEIPLFGAFKNTVKNNDPKAVLSRASLDNLSIVDKEGFRLYYSKKLIAIILIFIGLLFWGQDFFYLDIEKGCFIKIAPSWLEFSNKRIKTALGIIKNVSPEDYTSICTRVRTINPNISCTGMEGGCYSRIDSRTIDVSSPGRTLTWLAEVVAHEACHVRQRDENRDFDENECHLVGLHVMQKATQY